MRLVSVVSMAVAALCLVWFPGGRAAAAQRWVEVDLIDRDSGAVLPEYARHSAIFVPGEPGRRYSVRLHNRSQERMLVVLSVDGVNAVTGETADPAQAGYVLGPWETADILGWRKSLDDIAQFYFTALPDSYERPTPDPLPPPPWARTAPQPGARDESSAAASTNALGAPVPGQARRSERVGTGHGAREWSPTRHTGFVRASRRPAQVTELRYESPQTLASMGILPRWPAPRGDVQAPPRAFPDGFVPDPPAGW